MGVGDGRAGLVERTVGAGVVVEASAVVFGTVAVARIGAGVWVDTTDAAMKVEVGPGEDSARIWGGDVVSGVCIGASRHALIRTISSHIPQQR